MRWQLAFLRLASQLGSTAKTHVWMDLKPRINLDHRAIIKHRGSISYFFRSLLVVTCCQCHLANIICITSQTYCSFNFKTAIWIIASLWYLNGTRLQTNVLQKVHQSLLQTPMVQPVFNAPVFYNTVSWLVLFN